MGKYTYNGKLYDTDVLRTGLDREFSGFVSSLKGGSKHYQLFYEAYNNLMNGLADGSITFENGHFVDSKNRYSNNVFYDSSGKKIGSDKYDYYGTAARYIMNGMSWLPEYSDPSKVKWSNHALSDLFKKTFFSAGNSDAMNLRLFHDLDVTKEGEGPHSTANRRARLYNFFGDTLKNFDNIFYGYSDTDKQQAWNDINNAIRSLESDSTLDLSEYIDISKVLPGVDVYKLMYQGDMPYEDLNKPPTVEDFAKWYHGSHKPSTGLALTRQIATSKLTLNLYDELAKKIMELYTLDLANNSTAFNRMVSNAFTNYADNDTLISGALNLGFDVSSSDFLRGVFTTLDSPNVVSTNPKTNRREYHYIDDNGMGYSMDDKNFYLSPKEDLGYYQQEAYDTWSKSRNSTQVDDWMRPFFTQSAKQGAVLKYANPAGPIKGIGYTNDSGWYDRVGLALLTLAAEDVKTYGDEYVDWFNNTIQHKHSDLWKAAGGKDGTYRDTTLYSDDTKAYQTNFGSGTYGGDKTLGYNRFIKDAVNAGAYNMDGKRLGYDSADKNFIPDGYFSGITDDRRFGREGDFTPELLAHIQGLFAGSDYSFLLDKNDGYYKLVKWEDPKLEPVPYNAAPISTKPTGPSSQINPGNLLFDNVLGNSAWDKFKGWIPTINEVGRLATSLAYNKKIADRLHEGITPVLKDPFELYSPITGAFSTMQFKNNQAANLRYAASLPMTSDASLQVAAQADANREARNLETEGFLIDDAAVRKSADAALSRLESNIKVRNAVANQNRQELADKREEHSLIDSQRYKADWAGINEFEKGVTNKLYTDIAQQQTKDRYLNGYIADLRYDLTADDLLERFKTAYPNMSEEDIQKLPEYIKLLDEIGQRALREKYLTLDGRSYKNGVDDMRSFIQSVKHGGVMQLINKVIHENTKI